VGPVLIPTHAVSESDNLGSTDSEVKKILTLHLPISEYDTLGSDSDGEIPGGQVGASQELVSFRHRMARGEYRHAASNIVFTPTTGFPSKLWIHFLFSPSDLCSLLHSAALKTIALRPLKGLPRAFTSLYYIHLLCAQFNSRKELSVASVHRTQVIITQCA
jgi:hypothetical protein